MVANAGDNAVVRLDRHHPSRPRCPSVTASRDPRDGDRALGREPSRRYGHAPRSQLRGRGEDDSSGGAPSALATADGHVWVALAPAPPELPPEYGARLTTRADFASLDPASGIWHNYQLCANLVRYPDKQGPEGSRIIPEVAEAIPVPREGGTTYTFRIRPGFRFSPPSNEVVTARRSSRRSNVLSIRA